MRQPCGANKENIIGKISFVGWLFKKIAFFGGWINCR